jgi:ribose transport system permease protein
VIILSIILILGITKPSFFNGAFVIAPLLTSISIFTIVGLSQMVVLSVGHMNLAVGQMASFGAMFMGIAFDLWKLPLVPGLVIGLLAGAAVGALSGWIIAKTGVNSFIVTLAMSFALLGLVPTVYSWLSPGAAFTSKPEGMDVIGRGTFADICFNGICGTNAIPLMVIPASIVAVLIGYLYYKTRLGREILMVGSNIEAARLSAISTNSRIILVHTFSGALAALAGFFLAASIGSFTPAIGDEFMLQSFVGPILGGTALAGGVVSVFGTVLGISLVLLIRKGLELFGLGIETLNVLLGVILLVALSTERLRKLGSPKRRQIIEKDSE